ncbi:S-layer homology domain-containing protein [Paenibacillus sp. FJAT-26967]|uniref:S-layer homology domain-containing protein n=1 Tax=Paenibacillus sp. FJAT-26967 TaxID=1729690 RepID=UPI00083854DE|nr:S-layer homology domain-containing protein [Paenibacillus sp. FJAT-26967]
MKSSSLKNSMLAGLLVTALLTPSGISSAAASPAKFLAQGIQPEAFLDLTTVSADRLQSIRKALALGLLEGDGEGQFRPDDLLTRQELATLLTRALQLSIPDRQDSFKDVQSQLWSSPYIAAVKAAGIMEGDDLGKFRPYDVITREEIAVTLVRASQMALELESVPASISDWKGVSSWAQAFVRTALEEDIMSPEQGKFAPQEHVLRADVAEMLISAFFPTDKASVLQDIQGNHVRINGVTYVLSEHVKGILQESNREVLQGARLKFRFKGRTLETLTDLQLSAKGDATREGEEEFSRNLVLNGHGAVLDGNLTVSGDYTSIADLTVKGSLHISKELQNDFLAAKLIVEGNTIIDGGDRNTVVFQESSLQTVDVNKQDVHVITKQGTTVQTMNVNSNASITADDAALSQVTLANGARAVELQGTLPQVTVTAVQPVVLSGGSNIGQLAVNSPVELTLNGTGTVTQLQLNNADATVIVGSDSKVTTVAVTNGASASSVKNMPPASSTSGSTNSPPRYEIPIADPKLSVGDPAVTIDLSAHFKDSEQTSLKFTAVSLKSAVMKASMSGNILTLTPVARGTATIKMGANDLNGGNINADMVVTVNDPPKVSNVPLPMLLTINQGDGTLDLATVFEDADQDNLTYEVQSSDPSIAIVSESAGQLTVKAVASGSTVIQLSASDGSSWKASTTFNVVVNQAPSLLEVPEQFIQLGGGNQELDLASYINDLDNDPFIVTAESDSPDVAGVSVSGSKLTLTPAKAGQAKIRVTVTDQRGGISARDITVTVNRLPVVQNPLTDLQLTVGNPDGTTDLSTVFKDEDQDIFTYEVSSSNPSVATASETGGQLKVHALASGTATITVKAKDGKNGEIISSFQVIVNEAPLLSTIPVQYLQLGAPVQELDLSPYVQDPENDTWSFTVDSLSDPIINVNSKAGTSKLMLTPVAAGKTEVRLSFHDSRGGITQGIVYVEVNTAPVVAQQVSNLVVTAGQTPGVVDLGPAFTDADQDTLTYEVISSHPALAIGTEAGGLLSVKGLAPGMATITVKAKDGRGGEASMSFGVEVNAAPAISAIPEQLIQLAGSPLELDLLPYIQDLEHDGMTLQAVTNNTTLASVQVDGFKLTISPVNAGLAQINVTVTDSRGGQSKASFVVRINSAPSLTQQFGPQALTAGQQDGITDLSVMFTDPDVDPLTYSAVSSDPSIVTVQESGGILRTHAVASGTATISVTASDGRGGHTDSSFTVVVNEAPDVTTIPLQKLALPGSPRILDLSSYLSDKEQDTLSVTDITYDQTIASLSINDLQLTMTPLSLGETTVTMSVYDSRGGTTQSSFRLKVTLPNQSPVVQQPMAPSVLTVGQPDSILNLDAIFSDPDLDSTLTYEVSSSDPSVATAVVAGNQMTVQAVASGNADITLKASDGEGGEVTSIWKVTVNEPPVISPIASPVIWMHEGDQELDLTAFISDPDAGDIPNLSISAISSAADKASVVVSGKKLTIKPEAPGTAQIELTVKDGRGGKTTASLTVTIKQNKPPQITAIPEQVVKVGDIQNVDLSPYLSDPDPEDTQSLTVSISAQPDQSVASVSITGKTLTIVPVSTGKTSVQLTVSDGRGGTAAANVAITVNPAKVNAAPSAVSMIYEQVLTPGVTNARTFDLSQLFSDPDGDPLTFTAVSASGAAAAASVAGDMLTLTPGTGSGSTKVTITADDGNGGTGTYELTVRTAQLVANGQINVTTKQGVKEAVTYDLSALFPNQTSFKIYEGTPDSTFTGPTELNGKTLTLLNPNLGLYTWVVGADGRAAVFQFSSKTQGTPERFFSEYMDGGDGRIALEVSYSGTGDPTAAMKGYTIEVHQYMKKTQQKKVYSKALFEQYVDPYIFIDTIFYDAMDLTNITYFNDELSIYNPSEFNTVALVLKRNGQVVDVLGDPNSTAQFMPSGGTLVRKSGIYTGSAAFSQYGEWNTHPKGSYQYLGSHTK